MAKENDPDIQQVASNEAVPSPAADDEKAEVRNEKAGHDEIAAAEEVDDIVAAVREGRTISPEMRQKVAEHYGRIAEDDQIAPRADVTAILERIIVMTDEEAVEILLEAIEFHKDDPNFPDWTMTKIRSLVQGAKVTEMEESDWSLEARTEAAMIKYHSPYPEVRSVTDPFDDPTLPVETIRSYFLGLVFMSGSTALNTFFSPRQPAISLSANVMQLLLAPCGLFLAKALPDWGFTVRGSRISLNPGPWSHKEQMFATIMFTIANNISSTYYMFIVQRLPQYLGQTWVSFGYEIVLALAVQFFGFGFAGLLRRFVIFPVTAIWPKVLPIVALNRALVVPEKKGEVANGWTMTRYRFFMLAFLAMFLWYWIPNTLFTALHAFNWMTWIAPDNFSLGMITGFYGGMGFNPIATFDWNVSGTGHLVTPWWSAIQQYSARVLSGLIIIGMYWTNYAWAAYTPINSNEAFNNQGGIYNATIISDGNGGVNIEAYKQYGPPYFSGANVFGQGAWFAWYPLTLTYVTIKYWDSLKKSGKEMWKSIRHRTSIWEGNTDAHTRMMMAYKEVPDWWFFLVLLVSMGFGIAALQNWPTHTPWWVVITVIVLSGVFLIPSAILYAGANVSMGFNVLFQLLAGVWFAGNAEAQIIVTAFGSNFNAQADTYIADQKLAHYSKLPPRAVFRAQMLAAFINTFIFIGMLNWMIDNFNTGTLCTWENAQHFVCTDAVLVFASAVEYGAFGVKNMFKLYPILPWCFLMGTLIGTSWGLAQRYGPKISDAARRKWSEARFATWNRFVFRPLSYVGRIDPAVTWAGALNWTGGNNLSYATNGMYLSFIFMYWIKRRYNAWWEKYNYILEAGFNVGVAISGIIQTFAFAFGASVAINWWGNTVSTAGVDFQSYKQNSTLLPIPDVGYFGLAPEDYPLDW
ncbi:oligopeptide transporter 2 [Thozetella sp. PMI_491]|nr:oligopeptide transporter 2 [Thozetella sp. PMI_491]